MQSPAATRWLICRICLKNGNNELHLIFDDEQPQKLNDLGNLQEKIELYGGIKIYPQNNLPNKICSRCLLLLRAANKFRDLCEQSQQQLKLFINPQPKELLDEGENLVTNMDEHPDEDCMIITNDVVEYTVDKAATSLAMEEFENPLGDEDEDEEHYVYEDHNESSQEPAELLPDESSYNINMGDNVHIEYYDEQDDDIKETKYNPLANSGKSSIDDEVEKTIDKVIKRRRRRNKIAIKNEDGIYRCGYCENIYHDKAKYMIHIKLHSKVKPHECEICRKRFSTTPQLSRHMNSHTGNRPYKCQFCEASFGDPSTKIKHERIHTNERPYKCEICPKSFAYSNVLKVHMMVHTGEKPHRCAYCKKTFSQLHHKNAHERRHRNIIVLGTEDNDLDMDDELKGYKLDRD